MRHTHATRITLVACAAVLAAALPATTFARPSHSAHPSSWQSKAAAKSGGALATFSVGKERFRVWTTNPTTIANLKELKAGTSEANIPNGRILRGSGIGHHNAPWHWHLDAKDIEMADVTTEVCDATPSYVEQHLAEFVDNVKRYCPWSAKLVALRVYPARKGHGAPSDVQISDVQRDDTSAEMTSLTLTWKDSTTGETGYRITGTFTRFYGGNDPHTWEAGPNATQARITFVAGGFNPTKRACFTVSAMSGSRVLSNNGPACIDV